jgi:hypothetical protein
LARLRDIIFARELPIAPQPTIPIFKLAFMFYGYFLL